jgi:hypothetical protein
MVLILAALGVLTPRLVFRARQQPGTGPSLDKWKPEPLPGRSGGREDVR